MGQLLFDFLNGLINSVVNAIALPIINICTLLVPGFDIILDDLNSFFNLYVWQYLKFMVSLLNYGLKIPQWVWLVVIYLVSTSILVYYTLKGIKLIFNVWSLFRGTSGTNQLIKK